MPKLTIFTRLLLIATFCLATSVTSAKPLNVMTSYPQPVVAVIQEAFEQAHPDTQLNILWRRPADAHRILLQPDADVDVLWLPSVRTFMALKAADRFQPITWDQQALPVYLDQSAISDPEGHYVAVELAGYVLFFEPEALAKAGLNAPQRWQDLITPAWANQLLLPIPAQVGFAPLLIDQLLQAEGWQAGWNQWQQIAANSQLVGGEGPFITEKVLRGQALVGLTMDFFATTTINNEARGAFIYPQQTAFNPAHAAILKTSQNTEQAQQFISYLLSEAGQSLLLHPDLGKLPVRPSVYAQAPDLQNPFSGAIKNNYDPTIGLSRRGFNAAVFDAAITDNHQQLTLAWQRWHAAAKQATAEQQMQLEQIREKLLHWPVNKPAATDPLLQACDYPATDAEQASCAQFQSELTAVFKQQYQEVIDQLAAL